MQKILPFLLLAALPGAVLAFIPVTDCPTAKAGPDISICEGESLTLAEAAATNYTILLWTSSGKGSFDDPASLNPTYKPNKKDLAAGSVSLTLTAVGAEGCPDAVSSIVVTFISAPRANAGGADAVRPGESYMLSYSIAENYTGLTWSSSGTGFFNDFHDLHPTYTPSAEDIRFGSVTLTLTATGKGKCPPAVSDMVLNIN